MLSIKGNLDKITKMLPDSIDNIRLILEIEKSFTLWYDFERCKIRRC